MFTAFLTGNLGSDPTYDRTKNEVPRARFRMAVNMGKDKEAVWYNVTIFGKGAEALALALPLKGTRVVVRTNTPISGRPYSDKFGEMKVALDLDADWIEVQRPAKDEG
jgi:single-stranded DNA-binding protein